MKGASVALLAWGSLQLLLGAGLAVWSGGSAAALLLLGGSSPVLLLAAWHQARPAPVQRRLPHLSLPVVVLAVGLALGAVGLTAGLWLGLVGAELVAFGLVWLGRELRAERRPRG
jgi:hypothetical protein